MQKLSFIVTLMMIAYSLLALGSVNAKDVDGVTTQNSSVTPFGTKNPTAEDQPKAKRHIIYYPNDPTPYLIIRKNFFDPNHEYKAGEIDIDIIKNRDGSLTLFVSKAHSSTYARVKESELALISAGWAQTNLRGVSAPSPGTYTNSATEWRDYIRWLDYEFDWVARMDARWAANGWSTISVVDGLSGPRSTDNIVTLPMISSPGTSGVGEAAVPTTNSYRLSSTAQPFTATTAPTIAPSGVVGGGF